MLDWKDTKKLEEVVSLEQLCTLNSKQLTKLIKKQEDTLKSLGPKLADKGDKIKKHLEKLQDALSTVKTMEMEVDDVGLSLGKLNLDNRPNDISLEEKKVKHDHIASNEFILKQNQYKTWQKKAPTLFISFEESTALVKAKELEYEDYLASISNKKDTLKTPSLEKTTKDVKEERKEKEIKMESIEDTTILNVNQPKTKVKGKKRKKLEKRKRMGRK